MVDYGISELWFAAKVSRGTAVASIKIGESILTAPCVVVLCLVAKVLLIVRIRVSRC